MTILVEKPPGAATYTIKNPIMSAGGKLPNWHATAHKLADQLWNEAQLLIKREEKIKELTRANNAAAKALDSLGVERMEARWALTNARDSFWWFLMPARVKAYAAAALTQH